MTTKHSLVAASIVGLTLASCGSGSDEGVGTTEPMTSSPVGQPGSGSSTAPPMTTDAPSVTTSTTSTTSSTSSTSTTSPAAVAAEAAPVDLAGLDRGGEASDVEPGRYSTSVLSVPVELTTPAPMQLLGHGGLMVVLAPGDEGFAGRNLVVLAVTTGSAGPGDITDRKSSASDRASDVDDLLPPSIAPREWAASSPEVEVEGEGAVDSDAGSVPWVDIRVADGVDGYACQFGPTCINTLHHPIEGYFEAGPTLRFRIYDLAVLQPEGPESARLIAMVQRRAADRDVMVELGDSIVQSMVAPTE